MRIIHLASTMKWTGVAEPMINTAVYQKALGHEVWIGCSPGRSLEHAALHRGLEVLPGLHLSSKGNPVRHIQDFFRLRNLMKDLEPHVVHCHLLHDHWLATYALGTLRKNCLLVRTLHRYKVPYRDLFHSWLFFRGTDGLLVPTEAMRTMFLSQYPSLEDRVFAVTGGVNLERFHPALDGTVLRGELQIPLEAPVAGVVSRLRHDRGFDWLFASLPYVLEKIPEARIVIVGKGESLGQITEWSQTPPFTGRVFMAGYRSQDLPLAYAAMDISLFLALGSEGGCRAVMEAMSSGRPVIGIQKGPVGELIQEGITGFLVPRNNQELLSDVLVGALSDLHRLKRMGQAARARAQALFCLKDKAFQTIQVYHKLAEQKSLSLPG